MLDILFTEGKKTLQCDRPALAGESSSLCCDVEVTVPQRTEALAHGLTVILEHHRASLEVVSDMVKQVSKYLNSSEDEQVWSEHAKSMLAFPLAKYLKNELPPVPTKGYFQPCGPFGGWYKKRVRAFTRRNTHLWYSWFQAKRCTLPASESLVQGTYKKHYQTLIHEDEGVDLTIEDIFRNKHFLRLLNEVKKKTQELYEHSLSFEQYVPSTSACFDRTRSQGGQQADLRIITNKDIWVEDSVIGDDGKLAGSYRIGYDFTDELLSMKYYNKYYDNVVRFNYIREVRGQSFSDWSCLKEKIVTEHDFNRPLNCIIQGVLEPLKVRVISKGESLPYYSMKPLQKAIHTAMRDMDCFKLIGRALSPTDLMDLYEKQNPWDNLEWFSIDYSGATDGLSWKYSGKIFKYIIDFLPPIEKALALQVLGPHGLYYPTKCGSIEYKGVQRTGQLMGSILSFPILCLANMGVYLKVVEDWKRNEKYEQLIKNVLVNGDDMLYCAPKDLWSRHVQVAKDVGLKMSVGKAYHHSTYANINSVSLHCNLEKDYKKVTPWQINFLNVGLLFGQHKVMEKDSPLINGDTPEEIEIHSSSRRVDDERAKLMMAQKGLDINNSPNYVCNINKILEGCLPERQSSLLKWILHKYNKEIKRDCALILEKNIINKKVYKDSIIFRNLFIPISLGGMGVEPPQDWKFKIKKQQRSLMNFYITRNSSPFCFSLPAPGPIIEEDSDPKCPWQVIPKAEEIQSVPKFNTKKIKFFGPLYRFNSSICSKYYPYISSPVRLPVYLSDSHNKIIEYIDSRTFVALDKTNFYSTKYYVDPEVNTWI